MSTQKKTKLRRSDNPKQDASVLDQAIAAAISAPPLSKKASQHQSQRKQKNQKNTREKPQKQEKQRQQNKRANPPKNQKKQSRQQQQPQQQQYIQQKPEAPLLESLYHGGTKQPIKIIALGGLGEIGKNMYLIETAQDIVIIDCGMTFPDAEMPGVDIVIPDFSYVEKNKDKVRGVLLTHGHEDHIGGMPYLLKKMNIPVYGTKLTLGLLEHKLREHNIGGVKLVTVSAGQWRPNSSR